MNEATQTQNNATPAPAAQAAATPAPNAGASAPNSPVQASDAPSAPVDAGTSLLDAPAAPAPGADAGSQSEASTEVPEWIKSLDPDFQSLVTKKGWKDPAQALKSYKELETKLGQTPRAPKEYDVSFMEKAGVPIMEPELFEGFKADALKHGMSQKQFEQVIQGGNTYFTKLLERYGVVPEAQVKAEQAAIKQAEMAKLHNAGIDSNKLAEVGKWARANVPAKIVDQLSQSAEGVMWLNELRQQRRGVTPVTETASGDISQADLTSEIRKLIANPEYGQNTPTGRELQARAERLIARRDS